MPPPSKRKCGSQDSGSDDERTVHPPPKHSDCLYFKDGNIVLIAQDTAFRVHKSVLALHSEVFHNMFNDVHQPEDTEMFDGCAVVRLSDESKALETLLKVFYTIEPISHPGEPVLYFQYVLRLATKYLCNTIRRHALDTLRCKYCPETLSAWDTFTSSLDPWLTIRLGHDINAEILLPGAFYEISLNCRPGPEVNRDDIITYFVGNMKLGAFWPEFLEAKMVNRNEPPCKHPPCREGWRIFLEKRMLATIKQCQLPFADPLTQFKECSQGIDMAGGVCLETKKFIKKSCHEKREEIWNKLPEIFGLESWEKLRAAVNEDDSSGEHVEPPPPPPAVS